MSPETNEFVLDGVRYRLTAEAKPVVWAPSTEESRLCTSAYIDRVDDNGRRSWIGTIDMESGKITPRHNAIIPLDVSEYCHGKLTRADKESSAAVKHIKKWLALQAFL